MACGAPTPRILSLDDYFLQETTKQEEDPETGKKVQVKVTCYFSLYNNTCPFCIFIGRGLCVIKVHTHG